MLKKMISGLLAVSLMILAGCQNGSGSSAGNPSSAASMESTVSSGEEGTAKRVVAGTVSAAQYLGALGVDVAGIPTTDKELPEAYQDKPQIGMPMSPNLEQILACEPEIFVSDANLKATLEEMFYGRDIELVLLDNNSYDSVEANISLLAEKLELQDKAEEVSADIRAKREEALKLAEGREQPTVAIIFGTTAMFMLATDTSYAGSIVNMLGAKNITDDLGLGDSYVTFDREKLAELNPDVILRLSHADPEETAKAFETEFQQPFWQEIKAVQDNRVYDLDTKYFGVTANFDSIEAPVVMAELLYGE